MQVPFRKEFNAKLSATEARMEGRVARIEDAARSFADTAKEIRAEHKEMLGKISEFKITVIATAIASVLAIVLGVASFNAALTSNMFAAFQAGAQGKSPTAANQATTKEQ
jgi:hypothetical protein